MKHNDLFLQEIKYEHNSDKGYPFLMEGTSNRLWLMPERDAHIRHTYAYNTCQYYTDTQYYGVKAFAVEIRSNDNGKPVGDIYELDYRKHIDEIRRDSFNAKTVDVKFKPIHWEKEATATTRTFDVAEYNDNRLAIVDRYGEVENVRHNISGEEEILLAETLDNFKRQREKEARLANINEYVREMVKERFHEYGYTRDDMVFTTPENAYEAIKHRIPVYILYPDNSAEGAYK